MLAYGVHRWEDVKPLALQLCTKDHSGFPSAVFQRHFGQTRNSAAGPAGVTRDWPVEEQWKPVTDWVRH